MEEELIEISLVYKIDEEYFIEKVNAKKVGEYYQIKSIPAFAKNLAFDDLVEAENDKGSLYFEKLIKESGHSTIHIVIFDLNIRNEIISTLKSFGCGVNEINSIDYLVIDVPPLIHYLPIKDFLMSKESTQQISFAEACLSYQHRITTN